jgi:hypothetical protein
MGIDADAVENDALGRKDRVLADSTHAARSSVSVTTQHVSATLSVQRREPPGHSSRANMPSSQLVNSKAARGAVVRKYRSAQPVFARAMSSSIFMVLALTLWVPAEYDTSLVKLERSKVQRTSTLRWFDFSYLHPNGSWPKFQRDQEMRALLRIAVPGTRYEPERVLFASKGSPAGCP